MKSNPGSESNSLRVQKTLSLGETGVEETRFLIKLTSGIEDPKSGGDW